MKKETNEELGSENKLDPRQRLAWNNYIDQTKPKTFGNASASAISAGYKASYANNITSQPWWRDKLRRTHLLGKAEKVIDKILDLNATDENGKVQADILRVQSDQAKHITKTLGKDEGYSERTEQVGNGSNIVFLPQELINKFGLSEKKEEVTNNEEEK